MILFGVDFSISKNGKHSLSIVSTSLNCKLDEFILHKIPSKIYKFPLIIVTSIDSYCCKSFLNVVPVLVGLVKVLLGYKKTCVTLTVFP